MLRIKCPKCDKPLGVKDELAGKKVACPQCKKPFTVPLPSAPTPVPGNGAGTSTPAMGIAVNGPAPARDAQARVSFACPSCHEKLKIPLSMAGRQGPCPKCKKPFTVPALEQLKVMATAQASSASAGIDVEDLAASALAGPPPEPTEVAAEPTKIELVCHWCDEQVEFDVELAGKQAPCPKCRNILKLPKVESKKPKNWRELEVRGPSLAKETQAPKQLEGAWDTGRKMVGHEALDEAGAVPVITEPLRPSTWIRRVAITLLVLGIVTAVVMVALNARRESILAKYRKEAEKSFEAVASKMPRGWAAQYHLAAAEVYLREGDPDPNNAQKHLNAAFGLFLGALTQKKPITPDEEILLADVATLECLLGGEEDLVIHKRRLYWKDVRPVLERILNTIKVVVDGKVDPKVDGKLFALRRINLKLLELKQESIALGLATKVHADGIIGLDPADGKSSLLAEQIALLLFLNKTDEAKDLEAEPDLQKDTGISKGARLGYAQGYAYKEDFEMARKIANLGTKGWWLDKFHAHLAIAGIGLAKKNVTEAKASLDEARKLHDDEFKKKPFKTSSLLMYQFVTLLTQTDSIEEAETRLKDISDPPCRALAQFHILKLQAAKKYQAANPKQLDTDKGHAYALAWIEWARFQTQQGNIAEVQSAIENQDETVRPLLYIGIALGTK